jgi:hypothetical protein
VKDDQKRPALIAAIRTEKVDRVPQMRAIRNADFRVLRPRTPI